jgi:glutamate dehydrogenase/leucine dehydrogenase
MRALSPGDPAAHRLHPGPDMETSETSMAYVHDEIGRAVGLPGVLGGVRSMNWARPVSGWWSAPTR